jgi:hypothetical protein
MNLIIYLKTISRNVNSSVRITFPKMDQKLDHWIFVDQEFSIKILKRKIR